LEAEGTPRWRRILSSMAGGPVSAGPEVLAGLALLVIAVPEQLATSRLAGMPPITGLYAFVAGTVAFVALGSNPRLSVGADSTIAPLFAVALAHFATSGSPHYAALAGILAVAVGVMVAAVGLLRFGWIAEFLSAPIITGFLAGVAVIIVVHQLPDILGIAPPGGSTVHRVANVLAHLNRANGDTVVIAAAVFAVVVVAERLDRRAPAALIGLIGSTAAVAVWHLRAHGVDVLGTVAHGVPRMGLHDFSWTTLGDVLPAAAVVALVVISQTAATSRAFPRGDDRPLDVGRDFVGVGAGSILAGLTGSFPVNASPVRTSAIAGAGGRTKLAGLGAAAMVVLLVPAAGALKDVPVATLGAILVYVGLRLFHWRDLSAILRFDVFEFGLALVTLLTVALLGVEQGIAVAVVLAILDRTRLSARPSVHVMGKIPGTTSWEPLEWAGDKSQEPGIVVLLFASPLFYANAEHFRAQVRDALDGATTLKALVLDVVGMHDVDYTGSLTLRALLDELDRHHARVGFARAGEHLRANLERAGLMTRIGPGNFFPSVDEAVSALSAPG